MSSWNRWNALSTWLREACRRLWQRAKQRPVETCLGAFVVFVGCVWASRLLPEFRDWYLRAEPGQIIVNSPTVYTRQRLVNDRLSQTSWLRQQLKLADIDPDFTKPDPFRMIDQVHSRLEQRATTIQASGSTAPGRQTSLDTAQSKEAAADKAAAGAKEPGPEKTTPATSDLFSVQPTTAALFRAKNAFREEVRGEMTQTQLDDRHDIRGNTIYRLAFDATVIAGTQANSVAGVKITLRHHPYADYSKSKTAAIAWTDGSLFDSQLAQADDRRNPTLAILYQQDYKELYEDWIRHVQELVARSLEYTSERFLTGKLDLGARLLLDRFLFGRICEMATRRPTENRIHPACDPEVQSPWVQAIENRQKVTELTRKFVDDHLRALDRFSESQIEAVLNRAHQRGQLRRNVEVQEARQALKDFCISNPQPPFTTLLGLGFQSVDEVRRSGGTSPILGCPFSDMPGARLVATILLYDMLKQHQRFVIRGNPSALSPNGISFHVETLLGELETLRQGKCSSVTLGGSNAEPLLCGMTARHVASRCFAADFILAKLNAFDRDPQPDSPERIDYFFNVRAVGRDLDDCQIVISKRTVLQQGTARQPSPADELKYLLNKGTEAFAYSVTPKNLSEHVSTVRQSRDVFELLARYGVRTGVNDADAFAKRMSDRSDRLQSILNHPIVVGFGSARHMPESFVKKDQIAQAAVSNPNNLQGAKQNSDEPRTAVIRTLSFGWLIAPRNRGDGTLQQIDGQHALTAVISVPSWWRSVELDIETCWISREALHLLPAVESEGIELCNGARRKIDRTVIRLPGAIAELSRKLGFEVVQQPYLSGENYHLGKGQRLEIGQPGALLLVGGRLWRSTEVTLGAQRATAITVLPDMEGIIAHFSCVLPQSGATRLQVEFPRGPERRVTQTDVRVWTSEGVTSSLPVELWWPELPPGPAPDGRKWCGAHREVFSAQ